MRDDGTLKIDWRIHARIAHFNWDRRQALFPGYPWWITVFARVDRRLRFLNLQWVRTYMRALPAATTFPGVGVAPEQRCCTPTRRRSWSFHGIGVRPPAEEAAGVVSNERQRGNLYHKQEAWGGQSTGP